LIARGPDIRMGEWISGASITDLAPTFLHLMGLDIPEDIDGKVLLGLFRKDSEPRQRRVSYTCPVEEMVQEEVRLSHEQEILIRDRLRGLGYID
jgi:arylsulfatase A-like enzyme